MRPRNNAPVTDALFTVRLSTLNTKCEPPPTPWRGPAEDVKQAVAVKQAIVIDNDLAYAERLARILETQAFRVRLFDCGMSALQDMNDTPPAVVLVDWFLPRLDGAIVVQQLRRHFGNSLPLIVLSAGCTETSALKAFACGADDVISKPVQAPLLLARVNAVMRRYRSEPESAESHEVGPYRLNPGLRTVRFGDQTVTLTTKEFDLAWLLLRNPNRFFSRAELLTTVWGAAAARAGNSLPQHVSALRRKLHMAELGVRIASVYGLGYRVMLNLPATLNEHIGIEAQ